MDTEEFIELIRKNPCLYDYKESANMTKSEKEKHWKEIALAMEITSDLAKSKWKNLKNNYAKHLKSTNVCREPYSQYLHWPWASNMEFMKTYLNITSGQQQNHENDNEDTSSLNSEKISTVQNTILRSTSTSQTHTANGSHTAYIVNKQDDEYDATDLLFLGYAKTINSFSIRRQAEIKHKIAKVITDEEIAQCEETTLYRESCYSPSSQSDPLTLKFVQVKNELNNVTEFHSG